MSNQILRLRFGKNSDLSVDQVTQRRLVGPVGFSSLGGVSIGGVATDNSGNIYFTDFGGHAVYKSSSDGRTVLLAGSPGNAGDNDALTNVKAANARFNEPRGIAVDNSGNVYIADSGNNQIRVIVNGRVSHVAGAADGSNGFDSGTGEDATFDLPWGIAVDNSGTVWVADANNNALRQIKDGKVVNFAGNGSAGNGVNVSGTSGAIFDFPTAVTVNNRGDVFVADSNNNMIKKVDQKGWVYQHSGSGDSGTSLGTGLTKQFTCEYESIVALSSDANTVYAVDSSEDSARILRLNANGVPAIVFELDSDSTASSIVGISIEKNQDIIVACEEYIADESSSSSED